MTPSFVNLPEDVLSIVFAKVFSGQPHALWVEEAVQVWTSLRLVCRRWSEALAADRALEAKLRARSPDDTAALLLPWTSSVKITSLAVFPLDSSSNVEHTGPDPTGNWILRWQPPPPAAFQHIKDLELAVSYDPNLTVDCSALCGLPALKSLRLSGGVRYKMASCSPTLEKLRISYASQDRKTARHGVTAAVRPQDVWLQPDHGLHFLEIPAMPRLVDVEIDALGCMAVSLQQLMAFDAAISIRSTSIMIGVEQDPATDHTIVDRFRRPYFEGDFVPPHIWGDAAALEMSHEACDEACEQFLQALASTSSNLRALHLKSDMSFKIIPCGEGAARFWEEAEELYAVVALSMPTMYGALASDLMLDLETLRYQRDPEDETGPDLSMLSATEIGFNDIMFVRAEV